MQDSVKLKWYQQVFILLLAHYFLEVEAATTGFLPEGIQCACAGDRLIYNCGVVGGTATRWKGSLLLDCPMDVITLRHSQFESNQAFESCNNGDISGSGITVVNNCYTSQLHVTARESFDNKTVQCILNSNEGTRIIGESILRILSATNLYPPPTNSSLADVQPGTLVFNWTRDISNCSTLEYIIKTDCGTCPTLTSMTTATCSDLQLTTNAAVCHFRVSARACNLTGNPSSPVTVTLKVPNIPQVKLVPGYSYDSQVLLKLFIVTTMNQTEDFFYIGDGITGSPTIYKAHALNLVHGVSFNSTVDLSPCEEGNGCPIELPSCPQSTSINVRISAANKLGEGPPSSPFVIECTNGFVQAVYKETSSESTISCVFQNQSDVSEKTCCITYQICDQRGPRNVQVCNNDFPYEIELETTDPSSQFESYCYTVTATNATYTVKVEGKFTLGLNRANTAAGRIAAAVIVPFISVVLLGIGIIIGWIVIRRRSKVQKPQYYYNNIIDTHPVKQCLVPYHLPDTLTLHEVPSDCKLQTYVTNILNVNYGFRRGHTYYEFTNEVENILEGKEVLLQDKKRPEKWFQLDQNKVLSSGRLELPVHGKGVARSIFRDQYRVFIQSFGSGARHLPGGSSILYNHSDDQVEPDVLPLVPVCSEHFAHKVIDSEEECTVEDFCTQNGLNPKAFNMFLTVEHLPEGMKDQPPQDVILMKRESMKLFTGPFARQLLDRRNDGESQFKVFVLLERRRQGLVLKKGSEVLYQDSTYRRGSYAVLHVDQDNVRLSKFVEENLNRPYEDGKAFYEVTENDSEENLLYCKKILRPKTNELNQEELQLDSLIEYFYAIPGVPAKAVKPQQLTLRHSTIFVQSTSQGSRCLKKGDKILYLKEYIRWTDHPGLANDSLNQSLLKSYEGHRSDDFCTSLH